MLSVNRTTIHAATSSHDAFASDPQLHVDASAGLHIVAFSLISDPPGDRTRETSDLAWRTGVAQN